MSNLNIEDALDEDQFPAPNTRRSKWTDMLDELWEASINGDIPISDDGRRKFIKLGEFKNANGARTQIRALLNKGYGEDYEFKSVTSKDGSALWARANI